MMQLPKPNLEAMMMQSTESLNEGQEQELHQDTSRVDSKLDQTLLQSATGSQADSRLSDKAALSANTVCDGSKERTSAMFRSEEEELLESTERALEQSLVTEAASDRAAESIVKSMPLDESSLPNSPQTGGGSEPERGFLPVLKNRSFLTLWGGQVFSQLADKVYLVLMIALIASRFQAEDQTISGWVSSIMIASTIPAVLFGSIAGVYVDRWSKKTVLVITNLLRGGLVIFLPFLLWLTKGWAPWHGLPVGFYVLLTITFLVSTLTQFFAPAEQSAIPLIVERRHLLSANSLYTTTMMASVIVGFAVGEPLLAIADGIVTHLGWTAVGLGKELVVGGSYVIAGLVLLLLKITEKQRYPSFQFSSNGATNDAAEATEEPPHVFADIRDGVRYLGQQPQVRGALIQLVILFSVFAALAVLAVRLAEVIPEIKSSQFGFLLAAGGVGMAIGATFIGYFGQRFPHSRLSLWGSLGMALALAGLAFFSNHLIPVLLLLVTLGLCSAIVGVPMQTTIQEETPEDMRGKVFGLQNNAINIALSLPLALAGIAETFFGLRIVFLGLAALMVAGGVLSWYIARTSLANR
ncbi:MFS transporter [Leptolyngbya sp. Cla-17]|uniref:MFS transporter n=1 Tax=Leptolyngbya sp. Cla-17 TaxID=2803751 RepID=UPI0018D81A4E|nr:MFS transporter [Leptolyngbya sp. Cla-17]